MWAFRWGAIASIFAFKLITGLKFVSPERSVKCITFGDALIRDIDLQRYVAEQMSPYIHHFICINDPVPKFLRYTQSVSLMLQDINRRFWTVEHFMQRLKDISSVASTFLQLLSMKTSYSNIIKTIDKVIPLIG